MYTHHYMAGFYACIFFSVCVQKDVVKNMTSSVKISHVCTKTGIHFIAQDYSYTQEVSMHSVSTAQCAFL